MRVEPFRGWAAADKVFKTRDEAEEYIGEIKLKRLLAEVFESDKAEEIDQVVAAIRREPGKWSEAITQATYSSHPRLAASDEVVQ